MCKINNSFKNLRTIIGINYIKVIAQRSDDKFIEIKASFKANDNTGLILKKIKSLIDSLESLKNQEINGPSKIASNIINNETRIGEQINGRL